MTGLPETFVRAVQLAKALEAAQHAHRARSSRRPLLALTLVQPWAYAIARLGKPIENRTWTPPDWLVGGYLAIHAGKKLDRDAVETLRDEGFEVPDELEHGAIACPMLRPTRCAADGRRRDVQRDSSDESASEPFGIHVPQRRQIGERIVFATRRCCGPDGEGPCLSRQEGLACGTARMPVFESPSIGTMLHARSLRALRVSLGLGLRAAAERLGVSLVVLGQLERGVAEADDWQGIEAALREAPRG